jgi:hypothetical protein
MYGMNAAEAWFVAGTIPPMVAGGLHVLYTLVDTVRPTYFTPVERSLKAEMEGTRMRFGGAAAPRMWSAWLGFNLSHGLGAFTFGLLCLLIAVHDFRLVEDIAAIRPLTIAVSATYLALALRFWCHRPPLLAGASGVCFTVAAVLSA